MKKCANVLMGVSWGLSVTLWLIVGGAVCGCGGYQLPVPIAIVCDGQEVLVTDLTEVALTLPTAGCSDVQIRIKPPVEEEPETETEVTPEAAVESL